MNLRFVNTIYKVGLIVSGLCLVFAAQGCRSTESAGLSALDLDAVRVADRSYADAWLANDPDQVMRTLTEEPVIIPSGMRAIEGAEAIREFWWPAGSPPTTVTEFTVVQREVDGYGDFAFVRGSFSLRFEYDGSDYSNAGEYISLLRRPAGGSWKLSQRMWNDHER